MINNARHPPQSQRTRQPHLLYYTYHRYELLYLLVVPAPKIRAMLVTRVNPQTHSPEAPYTWQPRWSAQTPTVGEDAGVR